MKQINNIEKHIKDVYTNKLQVRTGANLDNKVLTNVMNTLQELSQRS